jgi:hypothetical protein
MTPRVRVAVLGTPSRPDAPWDAATLAGLVADGFTGVQLNIAWSYRPADEPLNLEDVWDIPGAPAPLSDPDRADERRADIAERARLAKAVGLRTILHVGMPYQGRAGFDGTPLPQCISDPATTARYVTAVADYAAAFPDVDDLLVYTYDQDAWICSEFGECERCVGVPLHRRLPAFLRAVARSWNSVRTEGRVWWEPWELSAGQTLACIPELANEPIGLMLHSSIAEVISTIPGDRFVANAAAAAELAGLPVVAEVFLSSSNEEVEPWRHLPVPLVTLRQLRAIERIEGIAGVKEYFGLQPHADDVNLDAARAYFRAPEATDDEVLAELSGGEAWLAEFWTLASHAYELYPWDATWFARQLGRSMPAHDLAAATVRGAQSGASAWDTPAWKSSRATVFMRTDNEEPHQWLLEDVGLRFAEAAATMERAIGVFDRGISHGHPRIGALLAQRLEAEGFVTRTLAYHFHVRETALAQLLRRKTPRADALLAELRDILVADLDNQRREIARVAHAPEASDATPLQLAERWVVTDAGDPAHLERAIELFDRDIDGFLATYFLPSDHRARWGQFSLTSR